jgi:hypothetical protein
MKVTTFSEYYRIVTKIASKLPTHRAAMTLKIKI